MKTKTKSAPVSPRTIESMTARATKATSRRAFMRIANLALAEAEATIRYAIHSDLDDAILAIRDAAEFGALAKRCILSARQAG